MSESLQMLPVSIDLRVSDIREAKQGSGKTGESGVCLQKTLSLKLLRATSSILTKQRMTTYNVKEFNLV